MDKNIDERLRKPRRAKGTPYFQTRNYYALGVLALSGVAWYLFEKIPAIQRLKANLATTNRFDPPPEVRDHLLSMRIGLRNPELRPVLERYQARKALQREGT